MAIRQDPDNPVYMKRGTVSKHLEGPERVPDESYGEYRRRIRDEQDLLELYMVGTPVDDKFESV